MKNSTYQNDEDRLVRAAWLYYEMGYTQQEIANRMLVSRATIGRLIQLAHDRGIVKIEITRPLPRQLHLEEKFIDEFGLSHVLIVETDTSRSATLELIAKATADFLTTSLFPGCKLGLAFSTTLSHMIRYINSQSAPPNVSIHELAGTQLSVHTEFFIASRLAEKLNVPLERLPVPVLVNDKAARDAILREESIKLALEHASEVDMALVGLGSVDHESTMIRTRYVDIDQISDIARRGAVGEVLLHFYDIEGKRIRVDELEERTIGVKWPEFLGIDTVIGVASGANKVMPILGALNGKLIDGLITDIATAELVIASI